MSNTTENHATARENTVLNILAASEKSYDYPSLHSSAVDTISTNISDFMYANMRQKSIASSTKRSSVLNFLKSVCRTPELHLSDNHYKIYLEAYKEEFCKKAFPEADSLVQKIAKELDSVSSDLHSKITEFYRRKNAKKRAKTGKQDFIRQWDQEELKLSLGLNLTRNISHYETSQSLIDDLLKEREENNAKDASNVDKDYREKQVQFCYALINIGSDDSDMNILDSVLTKISTYEVLETFEINLLTYIWLRGVKVNMDLSKAVTEKFFFIIEKLVIQFCNEILKLKNPAEVEKYFSSLHEDSKAMKLKEMCASDLGLYFKLKNLIFELYVLSYCNRNVLKLRDYIT